MNKRQISIMDCYLDKNKPLTNYSIADNNCVKPQIKKTQSIFALFKSKALTFHLILHCFIMYVFL